MLLLTFISQKNLAISNKIITFATSKINNKGMKRLAILNHATHTLFIEDVSDEDLERYNGSEQAYIEDNYTFEGDYSWDFITDIEYLAEGESDPMEVDLESWCK